MSLTSRLTLFVSMVVLAPATATPVDYTRDVKPILRSKCYACHGALKQEANLRLDTAALVRRGGENGPAIVPGQTTASLLLKRVTEESESERMPQQAAALTAAQIAVLRSWIDEGGQGPGDEQPESDPTKHWAFQRPRRPAVPTTADPDWVRTPVDGFVAAQQQQRGLRSVGPAAPEVLLRRVYLDLIGVPPNAETLRDFLVDPSEIAYQQMVDRLLASPQYGERWGRHWMDVWRYSDWYGRRSVPDSLNSYGQIWRWRDWIVRSLNGDKGYDRMLLEMLAADEIAPADDANLAATGFIVRNFYRWNYNTWMKDMVEHTGKAFLGITLNCCHCHDHKYDPLTNRDYFRFRAFFEPLDIRHDRVPGDTDPGLFPGYKLGVSYAPLKSGMVRVMDSKLDAKTFIYARGESRDIIPDLPPVTAAGPAALGGGELNVQPVELPATAWYPGLKEFVRQEELRKAKSHLADAVVVFTKAERLIADADSEQAKELAEWELRVAEPRLSNARAVVASLECRIVADRVRYQGVDGDVEQVARDASRSERQQRHEEARYELAVAERDLAAARRKATDEAADSQVQSAATKVKQRREQLDAAATALKTDSTEYTPLSPQYPRQSTGRRRALGEWIANRQNPLTARVAVNHVWAWHFARPLVPTTDNLGRNGALPSHPHLLDWLACELMDHDWQLKHLHRLIVTSSTYRLASLNRHTPPPSASAERDPQNLYFTYFPVQRMEAEVIRDSLLQTSGQLDTTMGGAEIPDSQGLTSPRRSLYFEHHGEGRMPWLELFDAANPVDCYRRTSSVRPQQALALANSELAVRQGRRLARWLQQRSTRVENESFVAEAFQQILSRNPTAKELQISRTYLRQQQEFFENESAVGPASGSQPDTAGALDSELARPARDPSLRARENLVQALYNHSDFISIR